MIPLEVEFERQSVKFEYLLGLVHFDLGRGDGGDWAPIGRFSWRGKHRRTVDSEVGEELLAADRHPLLGAGLFLGSRDRLQGSVEGYAEHVAAIRRSQF